MKYVVIYEKTSTGYSCYAPDLPGCIAAGDDLTETKALMERAIEMHLRGMREDGDPIPKPTTAAEYLEVPAV
jgi:predicted RNase H-like HicB family nuclease